MKTPFKVHLENIYRLGIKELRSLWADKVMLFLIIWAFTGGVYSASKGVSQELYNAPVAVVDQDRSQLSQRLINALREPQFKKPQVIDWKEMDPTLDRGTYAFVIVFPPNFQRDLLAGRNPEVQVNIDATIMSQSFLGASYIQNIFTTEMAEYLNRSSNTETPPIKLVTHARFNPNLTGYWFGGVMEIINNINMLTIILVGAAFIREREYGTLEHLMAMPLIPLEIMLSKMWASSLAVLVAAAFSLIFIIERLIGVPIAGSIPLFLAGAAVYLFSAASLGIFLATLARTMPQLGLLIFLTIIPIQMLSGGTSPQESMPESIQRIMMFSPSTYFVRLAQSILYRGANFSVVWKEFLAIAIIGGFFFSVALYRFRRAITK